MITFDPNAGKVISLTDAVTLTSNYQSANLGAVKAHYLGQEIINEVLNQQGAVGIRIYYGTDDKGAPQLVLTAVDANGNDMYNGVLADMSLPCPSSCDSNGSPLNGK